MIPSILSQQLRQGVEDFLRTTFPVSTPFFHGIIDRLLADSEGVFKGPYLSIQLPFRQGSGESDYFSDVPLKFPPYIHQVQAFDRLSGIKGSVKNSLAFLHPNFTISLTDFHSQKSSK